jgi:serine/threonine protein kinase
LEKLNEELSIITTTKINISSFRILKLLGEGSFGKVYLARRITSGKQYALKALKKRNLVVQKKLKYAVIEANILKQANNPFIINLHYAFQTLNYLYLALDYCPGRDLSYHLAR